MVKELTSQRQGTRVLDGLSVEGAVVDTEAEGAIGFAGKKDGSTIFGDARADPAFFQVNLKLFLQLLKLSWRHAVHMVFGRNGARLEVDAV